MHLEAFEIFIKMISFWSPNIFQKIFMWIERKNRIFRPSNSDSLRWSLLFTDWRYRYIDILCVDYHFFLSGRVFEIRFNLEKSCKCSFRIIFEIMMVLMKTEYTLTHMNMYVLKPQKKVFFFLIFENSVAILSSTFSTKCVTRVYYISKLQMTLKLRFVSKFKMYHRRDFLWFAPVYGVIFKNKCAYWSVCCRVWARAHTIRNHESK